MLAGERTLIRQSNVAMCSGRTEIFAWVLFIHTIMLMRKCLKNGEMKEEGSIRAWEAQRQINLTLVFRGQFICSTYCLMCFDKISYLGLSANVG